MAEGSYTHALKMVQSGWIPRRDWLANELSRLDGRSTTVKLALAEKLADGKKLLPDTLAWLMTWYRDLIVFPFQPEQIVNSDLRHQIQVEAAKTSPQALIDRMKAVQRARQQLQTNANPRLTMEDLVLQLAAV
jgi:DNA polymerase-3 subunit delta'